MIGPAPGPWSGVTTHVVWDEVPGIVLTALLALVGAVILQAVISPWTQRRTRRRERWETHVSALSALVASELPRLLSNFYLAARHEATLRSLQNVAADEDKGRYGRLLEATRVERENADDALDEPLDRLQTVATCVRSLRRRSPYWVTLQSRVITFRIAVVDFTIGVFLSDDLTEDAITSLSDDATKALRILDDQVELIADLTLPPYDFVGRFRRWFVARRMSNYVASANQHPVAPTSSSESPPDHAPGR